MASVRTVDGHELRHVLTPASFDEAADALRGADDAGTVVVPWGGGSMMGLGNLPESPALALDLTALNQVVSYEPDDLTIAVQAGCRMADLTSLLAKNGQMLPFDAADPAQATIGGLFATGVSGPSRFGYGAMRDLVIGITTVSPRGEISRGGGMVVKNVSGYDMMRLHYGAIGSLGVILRLNFKVIPAPRATRTVVLQFDNARSAMDAAMRVRESPLTPSSIVAIDEAWSTAAGLDPACMSLLLRADGPEGAVRRQAERLLELAGGASAGSTMLDDDESARVWNDVNRCLSAMTDSATINVRIGIQPSTAMDVLDCVNSIGEESSLERAITADLGNGQMFVRLTDRGVGADTLPTAWNALSGLGQHATLLSAPADVKRNTDVFGSEPAGFAVMQSLKEQFDPSRTLNRGRFIGRL